MKVKTITVQYPIMNQKGTVENPAYLYKVTKVTDSTDYNPGQLLTKQEVDNLAQSAYWKVTVVPVS